MNDTAHLFRRVLSDQRPISMEGFSFVNGAHFYCGVASSPGLLQWSYSGAGASKLPPLALYELNSAYSSDLRIESSAS